MFPLAGIIFLALSFLILVATFIWAAHLLTTKAQQRSQQEQSEAEEEAKEEEPDEAPEEEPEEERRRRSGSGTGGTAPGTVCSSGSWPAGCSGFRR